MHQPTKLSKKEIARIALSIRKEYLCSGWNDFENTNLLNTIITQHGIEIKYTAESFREKIFELNEDGGGTIYLPHSSSPLRDRFTIAHELGHFFLHRTPNTKEFFTRRGSGRLDWEANWFAADLLMPEEIFLTKAKECNNNERELGRYFRVTPECAGTRLLSLTKFD